MFTGLVAQTGRVSFGGENRLLVRPARKLESPEPGESIAVNGCCLTLEKAHTDGTLEFFTLQETLKRTNLGNLAASHGTVNLERALRVGDRLGGHLVSGHIDGTAKLLSLGRVADGDVELKLELPPALALEIAPKGSIAIDGVSLTVVAVAAGSFTVHLIPTTLDVTALAVRRVGNELNLETDVLAKYVSRQFGKTAATASGSGITMEKLLEAGFC